MSQKIESGPILDGISEMENLLGDIIDENKSDPNVADVILELQRIMDAVHEIERGLKAIDSIAKLRK